MKRLFYLVGPILVVFSSCKKYDFDHQKVEIPEFNFPLTITFDSNLSSYNIFKGSLADLIPSDNYEILELSSSLYTDYAYKQRLLKLPNGTKIKRQSNGSLEFPEGSILTKTFFYYNDDRDTSLGKKIIETRLLIKTSGIWNIATYLWNEAQTDATLELNGIDTQVSWINSNGEKLSTLYHVPAQNECMACHQSNSSISPLGPTILNLNKLINKNDKEINQITHFQLSGLLEEFSLVDIPQMVNHNNMNASLSNRGRAYLAMNCAHCHNPGAWNIPAEQDFDFRYETPIEKTGILGGKDKIIRNVVNQEMPFIGTTILDKEGIALVVEYIESL